MPSTGWVSGKPVWAFPHRRVVRSIFSASSPTGKKWGAFEPPDSGVGEESQYRLGWPFPPDDTERSRAMASPVCHRCDVRGNPLALAFSHHHLVDAHIADVSPIDARF